MKTNPVVVLLLVAAKTAGVVQAEPACPEEPPFSFSPCDGPDPSVSCDFGERCCPGVEGCGNPEQSCSCQDGLWECDVFRISCPDACPSSQPDPFGSCDFDINAEYVDCTYGKSICCGDDCIQTTACACTPFGFWFCNPKSYINCPEVCEETPPSIGDSCAIDPGFLCSYQDPGCEGLTEDTYFCFCKDSAFYCSSSCPDSLSECPNAPNNDYSSRSCTFADSDTCEYGEFCCPGEKGCGNPDTTCFCFNNNSFVCDSNRVSCPALCPEAEPAYLDPCDIDMLIDCDYGELCCGDDCIPSSTCRCESGSFTCRNNTYEEFCPEVCPPSRPQENEICSISERYTCPYDKDGFCSSFLEDEYLVYCICPFGIWDCSVNSYCEDILLECPITAYPSDYNGRSCNFTETCALGEFCCPGDEGCGDPKVTCTCNNGYFSCETRAITCPDLCPSTQPVNGDSCDLGANFYCGYGELCCGEDCIVNTTCSCSQYGYGWLCGNSENILPCPEACPETTPTFGERCDIDPAYKCQYELGGCEGVAADEYAYSCFCLFGSFLCFNLCQFSSISECPVFVPNPYSAFCNTTENLVCDYGEVCGTWTTSCSCNAFDYLFCSGFYELVSCPDPTPDTCDDDREAKFYSPSTDKMEPCVWLASRPEMQAIHCDPQDQSLAYYICEETCGKCTDECRDDPVAFFEYEDKETGAVTFRNCLWLSLRNWIQDEICDDSTSQAGTICPETCNQCDI